MTSSSSATGDRKRDSHRSRSSRTRMRQERLSNRFLAKLTGIEERPRVKRRQKRSNTAMAHDGAAKPDAAPVTHEEPNRRSNRSDDPYSARRQEYLVQIELVKRRQALFSQYERMQRQRHDGLSPTDGMGNNYTYQGDTPSLPSMVVESRTPYSNSRPAAPPPPPYSPNNDTDSDRDKSSVGEQRRHRRRRRDGTMSSSHSFDSFRMLPPIGDEPFDMPEQLPQYSTRQYQRESTPNNGRGSRLNYYEHIQTTSQTFREQLSPRRGNAIQSIDCSCGSTLQLNGQHIANSSEYVGQSTALTCDGTCLGSNARSVQRPTSIYLSHDMAANTSDIDDINYNVVNIGDCVSSAVAADPTIFGPHNLYQNPDMPVPDYEVPPPDYHLDQNSSNLTDTLGDSTTTVILEENIDHLVISNSIDTSNNLSYSEDCLVHTPEQSRRQNLLDSLGDSYSTASTPCVSAAYDIGDGDQNNYQPEMDVNALSGSVTARHDEGLCSETNKNNSIGANTVLDTTEINDGPKPKSNESVIQDSGTVSGSCDASGAVGGVEDSSSCSGDSGSDGGVMSDDELNDEEVALALQAAEVSAAWRARSRYG